ncbi:MAG: metal-dependent transcriptional regulator [Oscillospiraceae bacterium]
MRESGENYLETILMLNQRNGFVRSVDVATELLYAKPSVSRAMGILKESGFISIEKSGNILLTEMGLRKANEIYERHRLITKFLMHTLNVNQECADKDACRIEHVISDEVFSKMKTYVENM